MSTGSWEEHRRVHAPHLLGRDPPLPAGDEAVLQTRVYREVVEEAEEDHAVPGALKEPRLSDQHRGLRRHGLRREMKRKRPYDRQAFP